ncbi:hypothetical protein G6F31_021739 [Rhizopus arrhizus]|nr:hypothetical protein G6F31_021739 [Rhizopus arrhizus]
MRPVPCCSAGRAGPARSALHSTAGCWAGSIPAGARLQVRRPCVNHAGPAARLRASRLRLQRRIDARVNRWPTAANSGRHRRTAARAWFAN